MGNKAGSSSKTDERFRLNTKSTSNYVEEDTLKGNESINEERIIFKLWKENKLLIFMIIGISLGILVGILCNKSIQNLNEPVRSNVILFLGFPGEIFMRILQMLLLPLISTSIIMGLAELDALSSGRIGRRTIVYYLSTTLLAIVNGVFFAMIIRPGRQVDKTHYKSNKQVAVRTVDSILDIVRNMFPANIVAACFQLTVTPASVLKVNIRNISTNGTFKEVYDTVMINGNSQSEPGTNVLGIVVFSIVIGLILSKLGSSVKDLTTWFSSLNKVIMVMVDWVMIYSPIGIASLILSKFAAIDDILGTFSGIGLYMSTVLTGLAVHSIISLTLVYIVATRRSPVKILKGSIEALFTALGTSSSSATLPVTLKCLEKNLKIDKRITRFVIPIGATINMDGTALYEAVAAIFLAQTTGMTLDFGHYVIISITAMLASIGAAGIPNAGLITLLLVIKSVGLPEETVSLIIPVDWLLDRIRTAVNVYGDCLGASIIERISIDDLKKSEISKEFDREVATIQQGLNNSDFVGSIQSLQASI